MTNRIFRAIFLAFVSALLLSAGLFLSVPVSRNLMPTLILEVLQPAAVILTGFVIVSWFLSIRISRKIMRPLNQLDLDHPLENEQYDELAPLLRRISCQQGEIRIQKETLARRQNELDTILNHMNEGIILLNRDGAIVSINEAASDILELTDPLPGRNLISVCRNPDLLGIVERALGGEREERTLVIHREEYRVNAVPILEKGEVPGVSILLYNVTSLGKEERLRHEFTANVSHELKTPLQSISGYAELLKDHMVRPEDMDRFAGKIYQEAQRMQRLIGDIFSLSHLDEGAADVDWEWVDLVKTAKEALLELKPEADRKKIELSLTGDPEAKMTGKRVLLHAIVRNLSANAIQYGRTGGYVRVDIRAADPGTGASCRNIVLTVTDDGIGIPKEDQKRIFERFYRVDKSRSRAVGGTGLGLSIVRHAVLIHHGSISVKSEPESGSRFTVILPGMQIGCRKAV